MSTINQAPIISPAIPIAAGLPQPLDDIPVEPVSRGWFSRLGDKFKVLQLDLPNPGKFEDYSKESKEVTAMQDFSDGCKIEIQKTLSEQFMVHHLLSMGQEDAKGAGSYTFVATYLSLGKKAFTMGRFDGDGRVMGRYIYSPTDKFTIQAASQVALEANQATLSVEADYKTSDSCWSAKWDKTGFVELAVMQGVSRRSGLGLSMMHIPQSGGAMQGVQAAYRIWSNQEVARPSGVAPKWVFTAAASTMLPFASSFYWRTPKADISAEYGLVPSADGSGLFESQYTAGIAYDFRASRVRCRVDQDFRVTSIVEEFVSPILKFGLMADLDHKANKYKFGLGLTFYV